MVSVSDESAHLKTEQSEPNFLQLNESSGLGVIEKSLEEIHSINHTLNLREISMNKSKESM